MADQVEVLPDLACVIIVFSGVGLLNTDVVTSPTLRFIIMLTIIVTFIFLAWKNNANLK